MPLVNSNVILADARRRRYGIPSLLAGDLQMIVGGVQAAEALRSPLILAFNSGATSGVPLPIGIALAANAAAKASVPVGVILDHGADIEQIVAAICNGASSVMFDGSHLPFEENVRQTCEIVRIAHAAGVDVEAELGAIGGSSIYLTAEGPQAHMTDPEQAAEFVARTGIDVLAISFGNAHGVYHTKPILDLARAREIAGRVEIPLAMHGASGLADAVYAEVIAGGVSKICYYTAMGRQISAALRDFTAQADPDTLNYHQIIAVAMDEFCRRAKDLITLLGGAGKAEDVKRMT